MWKIITRLNHLSATEINGEKFIHVVDLLSLSIIVFLVFCFFSSLLLKHRLKNVCFCCFAFE